jgi:hypothetical protein
VNHGAELLHPDRRAEIDAAIDASTDSDVWRDFVEDNRAPADAPHPAAGHPLAVKYVPSKRAADYLRPNARLYIGADNFTWGKAVYVTGVNEPLSTAIYGRAGLVSWFDPTGWRVFDARLDAHKKLYLDWLQDQEDYDDAILTVHSNHYLHKLRNTFREIFKIDVVICSPDETDTKGYYTQSKDIWLGVSDWDDATGLLRGGAKDTAKNYSECFNDARLVIIPEEEFTPDDPALTRSPLFDLSPTGPATPTTVRDAYLRNTFVRVES